MTTRYHTKMAMTTNYLKSWSMPAIHGQLFQKTMRSLLTFFALQSILINGSSKVVAISVFFCFFRQIYLGSFHMLHDTFRHEICQNFYTAGFSDQKFYTLNFNSFSDKDTKNE